MNEDTVRRSLQGDPEEKKRCRELLDSVFTAFATGGPEKAAGILKKRMDKLESEFDGKVGELEAKL